MQNIISINPATEEKIAEFSISSQEVVNEAAAKARAAFLEWKELSVDERCLYVKNLAKVMKRRKQEIAESITTEMGKPMREAVSEVDKCISIAEYFSQERGMLSKEIVDMGGRQAYIEFDPLGIVGAIMPWNFPFSQIIRCAVPNLVAGNVVLFKPSSITPGTGTITQEIFDEIYPENIFTTLIGNPETARHIVDASSAIALTGSVLAGSSIAEYAGKQVKKIVLELGGSDPFIVLEDANAKKAAEGACQGRFLNCGQCCTSPKRFFVATEIYEDFVKEMKDIVSSYEIGNPMDDPDLGPLSSRQQRDIIESQVNQSKANIILGGNRQDGRGFFYKPTIAVAHEGDILMREETFGPVAAIMPINTIEQAVTLSNMSEYGLAASIWTSNKERAKTIASRLDVGMVGINMRFASDPRLPFGGIKKSGIGREMSHYGMKEFVNIKSVIIND